MTKKIVKKRKKKTLAARTGKNRDGQGRFIKGISGNPNGKPKGTGLNLTSLLKAHLETKPKGKKEYYKDLFIKKLLDKALVDNDIQALKLIINYCDGLPKQTIEGDINLHRLKIVRADEDDDEDDEE